MSSKIRGSCEDEIISHKTENNTRHFLVKLKNTSRRVWIPITSRRLLSENLIMAYYTRCDVRIEDLPALGRQKRADELAAMLRRATEDELNAFARRFRNFDLPPSDVRRFLADVLLVVPEDGGEIRADRRIMAALRERALLEVCHERRRAQLETLRRTEWSMNVVSDNAQPILLQNNVDLAVLPAFFKYVNEYVAGDGVRSFLPPPDNMGCRADPPDDRRHTCGRNCICMRAYDAKPAYDENGLIVLSRGECVHECNKMCRCDASCRFRVIQKGCQLSLVIFRCSNGAGWGVKTLEYVPKGTYVGRYVGKVVPLNEAKLLTTMGGRNHYLFDIDIIPDEEDMYTVDAFEYGNFTRFINHSCAPNLVVHHAWINHLDNHLHDLAFFALRPIECGEELTFNYRKVFPDCKCGSHKCVQKSAS